MKTQSIVLSLLLALPAAVAAADHTHEKKEAGPNGGRLLTTIDPHAEFFVTPERKVQITFLDEHDRPVAPGAQVVTVTAGDRAAPTQLTFTRQGDVLVSDDVLPAGNDFPTVVQIKLSPDANMVYERFNLNLSTCPECKLGEYACICGH
jgi:hypothetical protein